MNVKTILSSMIYCHLFFTICFASGIGTTGAQFLKIGTGARPVAMGGSFVAVANDANAIYWNPAGLSEIKVRQIATTYQSWFEGINYTYLSYIQPLRDTSIDYGTIGISIAYLNTGNIPKTDIDADDNIIEQGDCFGAFDTYLILSYGGRIRNLLLGSNVKFIKQKIEEETASTYALDGGILYIPSDNLRFGLAIQNIGGTIKFVDESDPLPVNIKAGITYRFDSNSLLSLDTNFPLECNQPNFHLGVEHPLSNLFVFRGGYKTDTISDLDALSGLSLGLGFKWNRYHIDYAWVPYGNLGQTHYISFLLKF